jgi:hypothetical protein
LEIKSFPQPDILFSQLVWLSCCCSCNNISVQLAPTTTKRSQNHKNIKKKQVSDKCRWTSRERETKNVNLFFLLHRSRNNNNMEKKKKIDAPGRYFIHYSYSFFSSLGIINIISF